MADQLRLDRTITTNIPSIETENRDLSDFVRRLNPGLFVHEIQDGDFSQTRKHRVDVENAINLLKATLEPESTKRITARDALYHPFLIDPSQPEDDELFPHPWGQGVCGEHHDRCYLTGELQIWFDGEMFKVKAGQYTAIGSKPCEFHKHMESL